MGFIDFTNGEVLTADQMDLVMRQGIMRFADATARDTALSAVLAEGMMAYLDDTNEVLKYDGTDWIDISGDITGVTAGTALTGGGTSGNVTLDVDTAAVGSAIGIDTKQDDVITTQGDLVIGDATGNPVRLPVGLADQVLTSDGTTVSFADAGGGGITLIAEVTATGSAVVIDNIPQDYQDIYLQGNAINTSNGFWGIKPNNVNNSASIGVAITNQSGGNTSAGNYIGFWNTPNGCFSYNRIDQYSDSTIRKTTFGYGYSNLDRDIMWGVWHNNAAITSLHIFPTNSSGDIGGTFTNGTFKLYGVS